VHVARVGEMRNLYKIFVGRPDAEMQLGRRKRMWEDIIKVDLKYGVRMWLGLSGSCVVSNKLRCSR
jgi:hypothetical protein